MSSKALQIRDKVYALLTATAMAGIGPGGVSFDPDYAFEPRDLPVVAVYLGDEDPPQRVMIGSLDRRVMVKVKIVSKGDDAYAAADALMVLVHGRIITDVSLGGLALDTQQHGTLRSSDVLQVPVAITEMDYAVEFRTTETSLET